MPTRPLVNAVRLGRHGTCDALQRSKRTPCARSGRCSGSLDRDIRGSQARRRAACRCRCRGRASPERAYSAGHDRVRVAHAAALRHTRSNKNLRLRARVRLFSRGIGRSDLYGVSAPAIITRSPFEVRATLGVGSAEWDLRWCRSDVSWLEGDAGLPDDQAAHARAGNRDIRSGLGYTQTVFFVRTAVLV